MTAVTLTRTDHVRRMARFYRDCPTTVNSGASV